MFLVFSYTFRLRTHKKEFFFHGLPSKGTSCCFEARGKHRAGRGPDFCEDGMGRALIPLGAHWPTHHTHKASPCQGQCEATSGGHSPWPAARPGVETIGAKIKKEEDGDR